ncbi:hypothetical protein MUP77_03045 [Candidatus Bathyarchaeota archaeon]|nr:hypothetical protein [Candidatus Bathyarchaeota archaeon]
MKSIKCSKCDKTVKVEDNWQYKRCEICRTKDLAYKQVLKDKRKLDREARNKIKELKLERAMNFSEWSKFAQEVLYDPSPTWERYSEYLKQRKEHEIYSKAETETYRLKSVNQKKYALINSELFPLSHGRECYSFRLSRLNGSENLNHLDNCSDCSDWNYNFINDLLPESTDNQDFSEKIDPIDRWETEEWRKRGATIPDHSLDRFKSKPEPENPTPDKISYQRLEQPEPHNSEPEQPDPTSSRDDLQNILSEHDQRKKGDQKAQGD